MRILDGGRYGDEHTFTDRVLSQKFDGIASYEFRPTAMLSNPCWVTSRDYGYRLVSAGDAAHTDCKER
jgi:hypothetical protein